MRVAPAGGMSVDGNEFVTAVTAIIKERQPRRIVESGTYLGMGTTKVVAEALEGAYQFFTIEANPAAHAEASQNLAKYPNIRVLLGYSLPKLLMPTEVGLVLWLEELKDKDIYVDFQEHERIACYMREGGHHVPFGLFGVCLRYFQGNIDLLILDSAGHMGFIEFQYVLRFLNSPCIFILDDTKHVKHYQSLLEIKADPRFTLLTESDEKFGFCIAEFKPERKE